MRLHKEIDLFALAEIYVISRDSLGELEKAAALGSDSYVPALFSNTKARIRYEYSGYILATLLPVLETEYQIKLTGSEPEFTNVFSKVSGVWNVILTDIEKDAYADKLDPALFFADKLQASYETFNATSAPGVGEIMLNGVRFLRAGLMQTATDKISILVIDIPMGKRSEEKPRLVSGRS